VVHTVHNLAELEVERLSLVIQSIAFRAGVVPVAIGEAVAESMHRLYRLPPRHQIPNGIPVSDYAPPPRAREEVRASLAIPGDAPTFVTVGRLQPQKDSKSLIEAFASERLRLLGAHLLLAGDGELRRGLEGQASALGIGERVHFLGVRADIPRVLAAADVFVLASRYEGNPLTVMEAMAAGKPVLATAVGCVPELVSDCAGLLVAPGDGPALEAAMVDLASDLTRARARGEAAALVARSRFDASVMASAYEKLYAEVT
jgi:glycosyltransferase involved in cell wall biosynthesis